MKYFESNGVRLAYRIDGPEDAPALVMLNSLGTDMRMWNPQLPWLGHELRLVRCDCRGHGASDAPEGPYTIEQLGRDLLSLLDTLHIQRAHICGLSLGGMIAQWFAANYPERVDRVVFANTGARIGTVESWNARIEAVKAGGMAAIRDMVLARFLSAGFRKQHPEMVQWVGEMLDSMNPVGYIGACAAVRDTDLHNLLPQIHAPSLVIGGELDESTPPSLVRELHAALNGSELVIFDEVAHLSNIEQPEAFSKAVLTFLVRA